MMKIFSICSILAILLVSCGEKDPVFPKPRGYFRINMPEQKYRLFDSTYPYSFMYPVCATIKPDRDFNTEPFWINMVYPQFQGEINFSYKPIKGNLYQLMEDARSLANKHIPKANEIQEKLIMVPENNVYGTIYLIKGTSTASPLQFFLTDSVNHYIRGALYFNHYPNNDSIAPVIDYIYKDVEMMISTLKWK